MNLIEGFGVINVFVAFYTKEKWAVSSVQRAVSSERKAVSSEQWAVSSE